jgi:CheY-like chemotaxis protein
MNHETILIVEDEAHTADLLRAIFEKEGYQVSVARDGREALTKAVTEQPTLILLDLILPDIEGFEVVRRLKAEPRTAHLPVVILTSRLDFEDKLRGLRLGALEYLTKPFQRQELTYRVRNILRLCGSMAPGTADDSEQKQVQELLEQMTQRHVRALIPKTNRDARLGFEYPEAAQIFKPVQVGEEVEKLEALADQQILDRVFFDTIHLCPSCGHHDLNFREVCPYCDSPEIEAITLLVHQPCGVALEPGPTTHCPKCQKEVSEADDEFAKASGYRCNGCSKIFAEPLVTCRCMNCDRIFDVDEAVKRAIYSYALRSDSLNRFLQVFGTGEKSAAQPAPGPPWKELPAENALLKYVVQRVGLPVVEEDALEKRFEQLVRKAEKEEQAVTLMALQLLRLEKLSQQLGQREMLRLMGRVSWILKRYVRPQDEAVVRRKDQIVILMPNTPMGIAKVVAERIRTHLLGLHEDLDCKITLASYPEDGANAQEVLEILDAGIVTIDGDLSQ